MGCRTAPRRRRPLPPHPHRPPPRPRRRLPLLRCSWAAWPCAIPPRPQPQPQHLAPHWRPRPPPLPSMAATVSAPGCRRCCGASRAPPRPSPCPHRAAWPPRRRLRPHPRRRRRRAAQRHDPACCRVTPAAAAAAAPPPPHPASGRMAPHTRPRPCGQPPAAAAPAAPAPPATCHSASAQAGSKHATAHQHPLHMRRSHTALERSPTALERSAARQSGCDTARSARGGVGTHIGRSRSLPNRGGGGSSRFTPRWAGCGCGSSCTCHTGHRVSAAVEEAPAVIVVTAAALRPELRCSAGRGQATCTRAQWGVRRRAQLGGRLRAVWVAVRRASKSSEESRGTTTCAASHQCARLVVTRRERVESVKHASQHACLKLACSTACTPCYREGGHKARPSTVTPRRPPGFRSLQVAPSRPWVRVDGRDGLDACVASAPPLCPLDRTPCGKQSITTSVAFADWQNHAGNWRGRKAKKTAGCC